MSDIINDNNIDDKKEDQNDITARHLFVINESQVGLDEPKGETPKSIRRVYNAGRHFFGDQELLLLLVLLIIQLHLRILILSVSNLDYRWKLVQIH